MTRTNATNGPSLSVEERKARLATLVKEGRISQAAADRIGFGDAPAFVDEFGKTLTGAAEKALARGQRATA